MLTKEQNELVDWIKTIIEHRPNELNQVGFNFKTFWLRYDFCIGKWYFYIGVPYFGYDPDTCNFLHRQHKIIINFNTEMIYNEPDKLFCFINKGIEMCSTYKKEKLNESLNL